MSRGTNASRDERRGGKYHVEEWGGGGHGGWKVLSHQQVVTETGVITSCWWLAATTAALVWEKGSQTLLEQTLRCLSSASPRTLRTFSNSSHTHRTLLPSIVAQLALLLTVAKSLLRQESLMLLSCTWFFLMCSAIQETSCGVMWLWDSENFSNFVVLVDLWSATKLYCLTDKKLLKKVNW